ncbi:hypothetical protein AO946_37180 [Pseudomonas aeruginosa]|nr:hypothetical protein HV98_33340 [Pseudomonas aeruginosa]SSU09045.1 phage lysis regulatory protein, LysB family [Acinetobacter baumannii]KSC59369.2 hypothetical protein AO895_31245 [Pseudomonas aeruginosa]KSG22709.2 hypothetical protein AO946_37180 [Pseudomonas aeruginosa]KSL40571.2 hypothetical protein APA56_30625 [Pseudomonas aeruginosa]
MTWRPWLVVALVTALVFWRMDHLAQDREAEQRRAEAAETERDRKQQMIDLQAGVLAEQQRQLGRVAEIERQTRQLGQALEIQGTRHAAALRELKENDQAVRDWLRAGIPAGLGRMYARPETTDPSAYRAADQVPADAVSAPRPSAASER